MKLAHLALVTSLFSCSANQHVAIDAGAPAPSPTKATFTIEQRIVIANSNRKHLAFPDLTRLRDGRFLITYREGKSHVDDTGRLIKQFGSTDGVTWTEPEVLYDTPGVDDRDGSVVTLANGDVMLNYFQYTTWTQDLTLYHVFMGRSTDDGKTFGAFTQVDAGSMSPSDPTLNAMGKWVDQSGQRIFVQATSSGVFEFEGRLLVPIYGGDALNLSNLIRPANWGLSLIDTTGNATAVLREALANTWPSEPAFLTLANGTTVVHFRTADGASPSNAGKMMQATSTDGLQSWSTPVAFPFVGHAPYLAQLSGGLVISAYRELDDKMTRESVAFSYSLSNAQTWSEPISVLECGAAECGYPSIASIDSSRFILAYYTPGAKSIEAAIIRYALE